MVHRDPRCRGVQHQTPCLHGWSLCISVSSEGPCWWKRPQRDRASAPQQVLGSGFPARASTALGRASCLPPAWIYTQVKGPLASLVAQLVKNPPAMQETPVRFLGWEDPLEEGMATHSSILAWRTPIDREAWWAAIHGVAKSGTRLSA